MKKFILLLLFAFIFSLTTAAGADFYTWEDEDGTTHITDYPPPQGKSGQGVKIHRDEGATPSDAKESAQGTPAKEPDVILFTKNVCPDCDKARDFLNSQNINFTEYNMDTDPNAAAKRKAIDDNSEVPFAVINRSQVYGFSESVYKRVLNINPQVN